MTTPKPETLPYPPPIQDLATLALHVCMCERTIERHVEDGEFPQPVMQGGKRVWIWAEIIKHYADKRKPVPESPGLQPGEIADAVKQDVLSRMRRAS